MENRVSIPKLKKKADKLYSQVLRQKAASKGGLCKCYTCDVIKPWKQLQCGHFVTRTVTSLRYHPKNTRPQCVGCNMFNQGRPEVFAYNLIQEYGVDIITELIAIKKNKLTNTEVRALLMQVIADCEKALTNSS